MTHLPCPLATSAARFARRIAVDSPTESISYAQLDEDVDATVRELRVLGVRSGHRVAIQAQNSLQLIRFLWALFRLQAVGCVIDTRWPPRAAREAVELVSARRLLTKLEMDSVVCQASERQVTATVDDEQLATIVFSAGSTGEPKAIALDLRAHLANAVGANQNLPLEAGDRWLLALPLCHVAGYGVMFRSVLAGATIVLPRDGAELAATVTEQRISHVSVVPTQLRQLCGDTDAVPRSLQAILLGGSAWSRRWVRDAIDRGWPIYTTYGLSEMASQVTTTSRHTPRRCLGTAGRVLPHRQIRLAKNGEILVRGATLFRGYVHQDDLELPLDSAGWFHTRDRGELDDDGYLTVFGRMDLLFVSGGENIYPEEIERLLLEQDDVERAIVVSVPNDQYGHRPVAFVASARHQPEQWRERLRQVLPSFKIPDRFLPWPANAATGMKVNRREFSRLARELTSFE